MKNERTIFMLLGILALVVTTFLFINTQTLDNDSHTQINESLRVARQTDALLNQQIINARYQLTHNYDLINDYVAQLRKTAEELKHGPLQDFTLESPRIDNAINDTERVLTKKFSLIEDFKTDNALFKNSLHRLPDGVHEFMDAARGEQEKRDAQNLGEILRGILTYNLTHDAQLKAKLQKDIDVLQLHHDEYHGATQTTFSNLLEHAELVLRMRETLDETVAELLNMPVEATSADLQSAYFAYYKQRSIASERFRAALYGISSLLLAYVVYILIKLRANTHELFREKERAQVTLHSIGDGVITTDAQGHVDYMNPIAEILTGWSNKDARGHPLPRVFNIVDEFSYRPLPDPAKRCMDEARVVEVSDHTLLCRGDGRESAIENSAAPIRDRNNRIIGAVVVFHDVSKTRSMARELQWHASHDPLTGLANRREFEQRLRQALLSAKEHDFEHAVLYLDLDQFKVVNDTCGHVAGDELLRQITSIMHPNLRATDTLARLGGDEFGLLLENCPLGKAVNIANQMRRALNDFRFAWNNKVFTVGGSIGVVPITQHSESVDEVLSAADVACYAAKDEGRNRVHVYQADDHDVLKRHGEMQWTARITHALEEARFRLYIQKIVAVAPTLEGETHYEILLRMIDEHGDTIPPGAFLPAAERYNMMPTVDRWVVGNALQNIRTIQSKASDVFAINLSGHSLSDESFLAYTVSTLQQAGVPGSKICFEITETAAIANLERAMKFITTLKGMGCRFALDDFGMGLSSYAYLKNLPVDYLKIDGTFVRDMADDPRDREMVKAVNQIAHTMNIKTIAECVETEAVWKKVVEMNIDFAQGYHIEKPHLWLSAVAERNAAHG